MALGNGATTAAAVTTASGTIGGTTYTYAGGTPTGVMSVGTSGATRQLATLSRAQVAGPPERNFPLPVVVGHGLFATTTIALVLLTAFGVGGS